MASLVNKMKDVLHIGDNHTNEETGVADQARSAVRPGVTDTKAGYGNTAADLRRPDTGLTGHHTPLGTPVTGTGVTTPGATTGVHTGATTGTGYGTAGTTGAAAQAAKSHIPGTTEHRERAAIKDTTGGHHTGMGTGVGTGLATGAGVGSAAGMTGHHGAQYGQTLGTTGTTTADNYGTTGSTGIAPGATAGTAGTHGAGTTGGIASAIKTHIPGTTEHRQHEAMTDTSGMTAGDKVKTHMPGTTEHREREAIKEGAGVGAGHHGMGTGVATAAGVGTAARSAGANVCKTEYYTVVEDRPVVKEVVHTVREHHPFEREMVVEHRTTGREREVTSGTRQVEHLGTTERIVEAAERKACP